VPLPSALAEPFARRCEGKLPDDLLITAPTGTVLRLRNWRRLVFDPAVKTAGLIDVTPHDLRHTAASLAVASGAIVKSVQPVQLPGRVGIGLGTGQQLGPRAISTPPGQLLVGRLPRAEPLGQLPPRRTGPVLPADRLDHLPVITPPPTPRRPDDGSSGSIHAHAASETTVRSFNTDASLPTRTVKIRQTPRQRT
jgi:hypothetical protein